MTDLICNGRYTRDVYKQMSGINISYDIMIVGESKTMAWIILQYAEIIVLRACVNLVQYRHIMDRFPDHKIVVYLENDEFEFQVTGFGEHNLQILTACNLILKTFANVDQSHCKPSGIKAG